MSCFVTNTDLFLLQIQRTFLFKLKTTSPSKQVSLIQKLSGAEMPFTCFIYMRNTTQRLYPLHHLISLSYSH